jgi:RNA polymerase sigma-70 factor (ECF subfamily)
MMGDVGLAERIERLYADRYVRFCHMAVAVTHDVEAARDAVQDAFASALARQEQFRGDGSLEAWLWQIVLRRALDRRRRQPPVVSLSYESESAAPLWAAELPHPERDPELAEAVRALPLRQRQLVFLRYFADLSHAEIAEVSGIALGSVSATLNHARSTLAQRLAQTPASFERTLDEHPH